MRLRERVEQSGLSARQITQRSGIGADRLIALINGAEPAITELRDLATALGIGISDFLPPSAPEQKAALLFRSTYRAGSETTTTSPIDDFSRRVGQAVEILGTDAAPTPGWIELVNSLAKRSVDPEALAEAFRAHFFAGNQIAPLIELPSVAVDECDVILYLVDNGAFDGASAVVAGAAYVFLSRRTFPPRMLFTLAHEIGHLIAHHNGEADFAVIDGTDEVTHIRPRRRQTEAFADTFAGSLLLPKAGVGAALRTIRQALKVHQDSIGDVELLYLARFFGVSFQVAASRCEQLGLLPEGGARSLYESIVGRHGNPESYARELGMPERPEIRFPPVPPRLLQGAIEAVKTGRVSLGRASSILNVSIADVFKVHAGAWQQG